MPTDTDDATQMALLTQRVENALNAITRVERKVDDLLVIDRTMAQMQQQSTHQQTEIEQLWKRVDSQSTSVQELGKETREFINRSGGAWVAAAVLLGIVQIGVCAWVGWVFSSVQFTREQGAVHEHRLTMLEQRDLPRGSNER